MKDIGSIVKTESGTCFGLNMYKVGDICSIGIVPLRYICTVEQEDIQPPPAMIKKAKIISFSSNQNEAEVKVDGYDKFSIPISELYAKPRHVRTGIREVDILR